MGEVNFYLKKPEESTGKSLIVLYKRYKGNSLVVSTGQTINPKNWNKAKQCVKNNSETTGDGSEFLNDFLTGLQKYCDKVYTAALQRGIPAPQTIRKALQDYMNKVEVKQINTETFFKLVDRFIVGDIKTKGRDKRPNTLQNYKTVKGHLKLFETKTGFQINFDSINLDFFYNYVTFLKKSLNLAQNSIAKDITVLKVFMGEAVDLGLTNNIQFKHKKFSVEEEETDAVYLTENEINHLNKLDLSASERLERARDLFVFGCYVGLRYSDYSTIKPDNIIKIDGEDFIKVITTKTKEHVIIPCHPTVLQIFEKYKDNSNNLPRAYSNQRFNDYIKEVCVKASLNETGRLSTNPEKPLFSCITSHSARRSFATNLYLEGYPTIEIMKITGHRTEKSFMKYIKISKLDAAKRLSAFMKKRWSEKMLKVA